MSFQTFITEWQKLNASIEALAAIGAELRLRSDEVAGDPRVRCLLQGVAREVNPALLDDLEPGQQGIALAFIQMSFRQALDLLDNPGRAPGWQYEDPVILDSQGQVSRMIVRFIETAAAQHSPLQAALGRSGRLLDIGTGAAWLAIEAARSWPALQIVGIDSWEPALRLAQKNVSASNLDNRIELRLQPVEQLKEISTFTLAWLPAPFIPEATVGIALPRILEELAPGGFIIVGIYLSPPTALAQALSDLRTVRSGGHPWTAFQMEDQLMKSGFDSVETLSPNPAISLVIGRRGRNE